MNKRRLFIIRKDRFLLDKFSKTIGMCTRKILGHERKNLRNLLGSRYQRPILPPLRAIITCLNNSGFFFFFYSSTRLRQHCPNNSVRISVRRASCTTQWRRARTRYSYEICCTTTWGGRFFFSDVSVITINLRPSLSRVGLVRDRTRSMIESERRAGGNYIIIIIIHTNTAAHLGFYNNNNNNNLELNR